MPPLHVTDKTSIKDLQQFAQTVGDGAKIRGKAHKDGSITLYVSTKKGTGLKNYLFGTTAKRRSDAQSAITQIMYANTKRTDLVGGRSKLDDDITFVMGSLPNRADELSGKTLKEVASMAMDAFSEATAKATLPSGISMDDKGNISGKHVITKSPTDCTGQAQEFKGQDLAKGLEKLKQASLTGSTSMIGNHKVINQALSDFWRLDINIPQSKGGPFVSRNDKSKAEGERNLHVANAVRDFAGSDAATTVLSAVLNQTLLTPIPGCLSKADGTESKYQFPSAFSSNGRTMTIRGKDNKLTEVQPRNVGGAKWNLSKVGNDFKISVDWQAYAEAPRDMEHTLPLHKDGVIGIQFSTEFIVDGAKAKNGELAFTMPNGVTAEFSGRLNI